MRLNFLHNNLKNIRWYDRWHSHPRHKHTHWFGLFIFLALIGSVVSAQVALFYYERSEAQAQTSLPAPNHPMMFGYFFALGQFGNYLSDVQGYNNAQVINADSWIRNSPDCLRDTTGLNNAFSSAVAANQKIIYIPKLPGATQCSDGRTEYSVAMSIARNYWSNIEVIYLADEPNWSRTETESRITTFKNAVSADGLSSKKIMINYTPNQIMTGDAFQASNLDVVSFEAYVDYSRQNEANLSTSLLNEINQAKARIGSKQKMIVIQGYGRNYCPVGSNTLCWSNIDSLRSIQTPAYMASYNDQSVIGLTIFSYARLSGTKDLAENHGGQCIKTEHQRIWGAISGTAQPASVQCSGGGSAPIQYATIIDSWSPQMARFWPELSPDGKYLTYGNTRTIIADLQNKTERDITPAGEVRCWGGHWIQPTTITFVCERYVGGTYAGMNRYEASLANGWNPVITSDTPSLVAANTFRAKDGHWASYVPFRIAKDNQYLVNGGYYDTGGLGGLSGDYTVAACTNDNGSICLYDKFQKIRTFNTSTGFNDLTMGLGDYIAYGGRNPIRGICISDGKDINLKANRAGAWEALTGFYPVFSINGSPWVMTSGLVNNEYRLLLRPFGQKKSIVVDVGSGSSHTSVAYSNGVITIAYNNDIGIIRVIKIPADSPRNDLTGGAPDETCGTIAQATPTPTAQPTPTPPVLCSKDVKDSGVAVICDFSPSTSLPGEMISVSGVNLSGSVTLRSVNGNIVTLTGSPNVTGLIFRLPSDLIPGDYSIVVASSNGSNSATSAKFLSVVTALPSGGNTEPPPFEVTAQSEPPAPPATDFGTLVGLFYKYAVSVVGLAVFVMILWGGFLWMTSAANPGNIATAKSYINNAILGAVLLLSSYAILYTINPELVGGKLSLEGLEQLGGGAQGLIIQPTCDNNTCSNDSGKSCSQDTDCNVVCINNACNNGKTGVCTYDTQCQLFPRYIITSEADSAAAFSAGCSRVKSIGYQDFSAVECSTSTVVPLSLDPVYSTQDENVNSQIGAQAIQASGNRGQGRKIVVLDTGYSRNHPELSSSYGGGWDFVNTDNDPLDDNSTGAGSPGHGSHVAGIITADGTDSRARGVAPDAQIIAGKVLDAKGNGNYSNIVSGIYWAINGPDGIYGTSDDFKPDAINISIGGDLFPGYCDTSNNVTKDMAKAIAYARDHGTLVVTAAGNNPGGVMIPGCIDSALTVGAVDSSDNITSFSGRGTGVDITAPGVNIYSTLLGNGYGTKSGTSMATPVVSGIIALIKSAFPNYSVSEVEQAIFRTAADLGQTGKDPFYGWGRINANSALGGAYTCTGACGYLVATPASCTIGATSSNPSCNINVKYFINNAQPGSMIIKKNGNNWGTPSSASGSINDNSPGAGTYVYTLNSSTGTELSRITVYIYNQGSITSPWIACRKNTDPANPGCSISLSYSVPGASSATIYKNGIKWQNINSGSGTLSDPNPSTGTHTYTLRDTAGTTQISRAVIRIEPSSGQSRIISSLSAVSARVGQQITINGTNLANSNEINRNILTVQIHDKNRVRHTTLGTVNSANTSGTWTVNLGTGMKPGEYTLRVGPSLNYYDISNEVNLTILP